MPGTGNKLIIMIIIISSSSSPAAAVAAAAASVKSKPHYIGLVVQQAETTSPQQIETIKSWRIKTKLHYFDL